MHLSTHLEAWWLPLGPHKSPQVEAAVLPAVSRPHSSGSGGLSISLGAGAELWGSWWCCSAQAELPFMTDEA